MTAPIARMKTISLRNNYLVRQPIEYYVPGSDAWEPWPGVPAAPTVRFSVEPTGFTDEGYPSTIVGPYVMVESGASPGTFYYDVPSDALSLALADLVGETIYQVVEGSFGSHYYGLTDVQPLLVIDPRNPTP